MCHNIWCTVERRKYPLHGIDGKTGEVKWADKDVVGEFYLVTDDLLVVEHKDKVRGYSLK
jgi:hypothetical protein